MRKYLIPTADTTIYQAFNNNNAGFDEILEIGKVPDVLETYVSASARALINFSLPTTASVPATASYFLNLKLANATNIRKNQKIIVYQVSQSWDEGSGFFYQNVQNVNDGATWERCSTAVSWSNAGGDVLSNATTQSIALNTYPIQDIRLDVTNILQPIVSQSLQSGFYGLLLQFPISDELDDTNEGNIKVFSTQTHTIYQPTLEIAWDNQVFVTGSLQQIPSLNVKIAPNNLKQTYTKGDVDKLTLVVRDKFPLKSFDSTLRYKNKYYLPASSYYSIVDTQSNTTVVPFDEFSKINTDTTSSYIILDTSPLYPGRFYKLKLKIVTGDYSQVIDTDTMFKVE